MFWAMRLDKDHSILHKTLFKCMNNGNTKDTTSNTSTGIKPLPIEPFAIYSGNAVIKCYTRIHVDLMVYISHAKILC